MTARRKYRTANFKTPPLDLRPRPPSAKGWELYHPLGHYPPIPDTDGFQRASAYHEAGHCIGYVEFDIPFTRAWMEHPKTGKARVSGRRAHTRFKDNSTIRDAVWRQYHEAQAILSMSGPEAEARYAPAAYILIGAGYEGEIHGRPVFL